MKPRFALLLLLTMFLGQVHMLGQSGTWTDPATKLMWATQDNGTDVAWHQATYYCANLGLGGYANWRLATIDELDDIWDRTQNVDGWHIKGGIRISGWTWSGSRGRRASHEAWVFYFKNGERASYLVGYMYYGRALCVRRSGK